MDTYHVAVLATATGIKTIPDSELYTLEIKRASAISTDTIVKNLKCAEPLDQQRTKQLASDAHCPPEIPRRALAVTGKWDWSTLPVDSGTTVIDRNGQPVCRSVVEQLLAKDKSLYLLMFCNLNKHKPVPTVIQIISELERETTLWQKNNYPDYAVIETVSHYAKIANAVLTKTQLPDKQITNHVIAIGKISHDCDNDNRIIMRCLFMPNCLAIDAFTRRTYNTDNLVTRMPEPDVYRYWKKFLTDHDNEDIKKNSTIKHRLQLNSEERRSLGDFEDDNGMLMFINTDTGKIDAAMWLNESTFSKMPLSSDDFNITVIKNSLRELAWQAESRPNDESNNKSVHMFAVAKLSRLHRPQVDDEGTSLVICPSNISPLNRQMCETEHSIFTNTDFSQLEGKGQIAGIISGLFDEDATKSAPCGEPKIRFEIKKDKRFLIIHDDKTCNNVPFLRAITKDNVNDELDYINSIETEHFLLLFINITDEEKPELDTVIEIGQSSYRKLSANDTSVIDIDRILSNYKETLVSLECRAATDSNMHYLTDEDRLHREHIFIEISYELSRSRYDIQDSGKAVCLVVNPQTFPRLGSRMAPVPLGVVRYIRRTAEQRTYSADCLPPSLHKRVTECLETGNYAGWHNTFCVERSIRFNGKPIDKLTSAMMSNVNEMRVTFEVVDDRLSRFKTIHFITADYKYTQEDFDRQFESVKNETIGKEDIMTSTTNGDAFNGKERKLEITTRDMRVKNANGKAKTVKGALVATFTIGNDDKSGIAYASGNSTDRRSLVRDAVVDYILKVVAAAGKTLYTRTSIRNVAVPDGYGEITLKPVKTTTLIESGKSGERILCTVTLSEKDTDNDVIAMKEAIAAYAYCGTDTTFNKAYKVYDAEYRAQLRAAEKEAYKAAHRCPFCGTFFATTAEMEACRDAHIAKRKAKNEARLAMFRKARVEAMAEELSIMDEAKALADAKKKKPAAKKAAAKKPASKKTAAKKTNESDK